MTEPAESPRARFQRVIRPRAEKALHAIELIGNGASNGYETTPAEIGNILAGLREQIDEVERRYAKRHHGYPAPDAHHNAVPAPVEVPAAAPVAATNQAVSPRGRLIATMQGLDRHSLPVVAAWLDARLVAALTTHLVNRLAEMAETKEPAR